MSISLKSPIEQVEELLKTSPRSTDIVFSCTSGGRGLHIQAWDLSNRAVLRTYRSDTDGEGSCLCMAGQDYLLCGLKNKPLIYVWKIEKVSNHICGRSFMEYCTEGELYPNSKILFLRIKFMNSIESIYNNRYGSKDN